jgi:hypothetical protein
MTTSVARVSTFITTSVALATFLPHFPHLGVFPHLSLRGAKRRGNPAGIVTFPGNRLDCHVGTSSHLAMTTSVALVSTFITTSVALASFLPHFPHLGGNPAGIATFPGQPTGLPRRDFVPSRNDNKRSAYVHFHDDEGRARNPFPVPILSVSRRHSPFVIARSEATRQSSRHRYVPGQPTGLPRRDFVPSRNDNKRGAGVHFQDNKRGACVHFHGDKRGVHILSAPIFSPSWRRREKPILIHPST